MITYDVKISKNGSSFLEIDTQDTNYYDGKTKAWV